MVIILSGLFVGLVFVNIIFIFLAEIALIILMVRYRFAFMILPCILALIVNLVVYDSVVAVIFGYLVLLPGLIMGYKARTFNAPVAIVGWGLTPYLVPVVLSIIFYSEIAAQSAVFTSELQFLIEKAAAGTGVGSAELQSMMHTAEVVVGWMLRLTPGIIFTMFLGLVLFAYLGAAAMNKFFGAVLPKMLPLYFWKASELWLLPLGLSMIFVLLGGGSLRIIGENLLVFFIHFYAFLGICLIDFYFNRLNIPVAVRLVMYIIMMVVVFIAVPVLALMGVIDSRFDFRKISFEREN